MKPDVVKIYQLLRDKGYRADQALRDARACVEFHDLSRRRVARLRFEPDSDGMDEHMDEHMAKAADEQGMWGLVAERKCPCCDNWAEVESVWGLIGQDPGGYEYDLMRDAVQAVKAAGGPS